MGSVKHRRAVWLLSLMLGVTLLALPACQKAKMTKKEGAPRVPKVQPDQDSAPPGPVPVQPQRTPPSPVRPANTGSASPIVLPTQSPADPRGGGHEVPDAPTVVTGASQPVRPIFDTSAHPPTVAAAQTRVVIYRGEEVIDTCRRPDCRPQPAVPPAPAPVAAPAPPPPPPAPAPAPVAPVNPCEQPPPVDPCDRGERPLVEDCPNRPPCPAEVAPAPVPPPPPPAPPQPVYQSKHLEFRQPEGPVTTEVDLLFVVDTSTSIFHERKWIVEQLPRLIRQLPGGENGTSYRIGVLPAHSPDSPHGGKLFAINGRDRLVLGNKGRDTMTLEQITKALVEKMKKVPAEKGNDAGELGLLSLYNFLKGSQAQTLKSMDEFMRANAALMVIFVADENDICYKYKPGEQPSYDERYHPKNRKAVEFNGIKGFDPIEVEAHKKYCPALGEVPERTVYEALREFKGEQPMRATGIVYTNLATVPHEKGTDQYFDENEIGRGYLELMALTGSTAMDMALGNFDVAMEFLGKFTTHALRYIDKFQIPASERVAIVTPEGSDRPRALVEVTIERADGTKVPPESYRIVFDEKTNEVLILPSDTPVQGRLFEPRPLDKITITWQVEIPQP